MEESRMYRVITVASECGGNGSVLAQSVTERLDGIFWTKT